MKELLAEAGLNTGQHVLVHSSFRRIKKEFSDITITEFIDILKEIISPEGSLIMPAFTYNWKPLLGSGELFDRMRTLSKTGAVSEVFRNLEEVTRTSSPTHSFALWGDVNNYVGFNNSPVSPLGAGSVLEWLTYKSEAYVLMAGTDFSSLSFGHYLEICAQVPWLNYSPWHHMNITNYGISIDGEKELREVPGCSKSFVVYEEYLHKKKLITPVFSNDLRILYIPVSLLLTTGTVFFRKHYPLLLCSEGSCIPCDSRRKYLNKKRENNEL